jgi:hypothetical protein
MANGPLESKAVAPPATTLVAGYLAGLAIQIIPWLKDNLTPDQVQTLPIIIAFGLSLAAGWLAPHTFRPDLLPPALPAGKHASPTPEAPPPPDTAG